MKRLFFGSQGFRCLMLLVTELATTQLQAMDCSQFKIAANRALVSINADKVGIDRLSAGFKLSAAALNDWANMTADQKSKLYQVAVLNLIQAAAAAPFVDAGKVGNVSLPNGIASIGPGQAGALINQLRSNGIENPVLFNLISGVATVRGKPEAAKTGLEILDSLSTLLQTGIAAHGAMAATKGPELRGAAVETAASVAQLGLTLMGSAYAGYATALGAGSDILTLVQSAVMASSAVDQISHLTKLNEATLSELKRRIAKLQTDVKTLKESINKLAACEEESPSSSTTPGREGFRVHWTDYPSQGDEARPVAIAFQFDPADGRKVDIGMSNIISDGKSGVPVVGVGVVSADYDFVLAPPGDYSVSVVVWVAYCPVPYWPSQKPGFINQPREGYSKPLLEFHARVVRGKTTDLLPKYSHMSIPPPEERTTSCVYRPPWKNFPAYMSGLQPLKISQAEAAADNENSQHLGGPLLQVLELRFQRVYLGFDAFREEFPKCLGK